MQFRLRQSTGSRRKGKKNTRDASRLAKVLYGARTGLYRTMQFSVPYSSFFSLWRFLDGGGRTWPAHCLNQSHEHAETNVLELRAVPTGDHRRGVSEPHTKVCLTRERPRAAMPTVSLAWRADLAFFCRFFTFALLHFLHFFRMFSAPLICAAPDSNTFAQLRVGTLSAAAMSWGQVAPASAPVVAQLGAQRIPQSAPIQHSVSPK